VCQRVRRLLDVLGTGEETTDRDARGHERVVVGAPVERRRLRGPTDRVEEVDEHVLENAGAGGAGGRRD